MAAVAGAALAVLVALVAACAPVAPVGRPAPVRRVPYLGWSTWSLQALQDGRSPEEKQNAAFVEAQSDVMAERLGAAGYRDVNIDSFWWTGFDRFGRQVPDPVRFPGGIAGVADHVHRNGQRLGIYVVAGLPKEVYEADGPIEGTECTARDIAEQPLRPTNGWRDHWAVDWSNPCAQAWIDSRVAQFASWGVDFVKLDGVQPSTGEELLGVVFGPSGLDNRGDVRAWRAAIGHSGRPMWLTLSWDLSVRFADSWAASADAVRITGDIECYCRTLTKWDNVGFRFLEAPLWTDVTDRTGLLPDFDSLLVGDGARDGLTDVERRSVATLWAVGGGPWYLGDDLTRLDDLGISLLTDPDVLSLVREGRRLRPVSTSFLAPNVEALLLQRQTWVRREADGSAVIAGFNLADHQRTVSVPLALAGLDGSASATDLWSDADLGTVTSNYAATLPAHGSFLVRLAPN